MVPSISSRNRRFSRRAAIASPLPTQIQWYHSTKPSCRQAKRLWGEKNCGEAERRGKWNVKRWGETMWGANRALPVAEEAGKSPQRRQWRMQQGDFEEVPRLAATIVAGNRLAQRWAGASGRGQNFKRPPLGSAEILGTATGSSAPTESSFWLCVGQRGAGRCRHRPARH